MQRGSFKKTVFDAFILYGGRLCREFCSRYAVEKRPGDPGKLPELEAHIFPREDCTRLFTITFPVQKHLLKTIEMFRDDRCSKDKHQERHWL